MVIHGKNRIKIARIAIEDTGEVLRNQILTKIIFFILSFGFIAIFGAIKVPIFKEDVWNTIKDFIIYSTAIIANILLGLRSAQVYHESRIRAAKDRLSYIENHKGLDEILKVRNEVYEEIKKDKIESIESKLKT